MLQTVESAVIAQAILAAAKEMGVKLVRSAYSTIIREAQDCSAALMDRHGNVVAQAELIPIQMGGMSAAFRACADRFPVESLVEGDFYVNNDPFNGAQHLPDVYIYSPIFHGGVVVGFSATIVHHLDLGGGSPGLNATASDVHGEGLLLPATKWNLDRDWNGGPLERLIAANVRVPIQTMGDFNAQMAANEVGAGRIRQLCDKYGREAVVGAMASLLDYSERRVAAAIAAVPEGVYEGEDWLDDDGISDEKLVVKAQVAFKDGQISVSFDGTSPQVARNLNAPFTSTVSATMCCIKSVLTDPDIPFNSGAERPIRVTAPKGSLLNPEYPAPVRARMIAAYRAFNALMKALAKAVPDRVIAIGFDSTTVVCISRLKSHAYQVYIEVFGGGFGAGAENDGCDAADSPLSNCSNTPIEALDMEYDFFRVEDYALAPDTFGHGRHRGGTGFRRSYRILDDGVTLSIYGDRFKFGGEGLFGGSDGSSGSCDIHRDGEVIRLRSKDACDLKRGDLIVFNLGGGAGYGAPQERPHRAIAFDVSEGLLSAEAALRHYGYRADAAAAGG